MNVQPLRGLDDLLKCEVCTWVPPTDYADDDPIHIKDEAR